MLRTDLKYVCLDFETTGLDTERDEAIQIGIVSFDHTGNVIKTFSSYIKPQKPLNELKDMVRVVTGLSLEKLADAPAFDAIAEEIKGFFDQHTVIIGHNVQFDISVLKQYLKVSYHSAIDTFPLAQSLMPFSQSYALEVLDKSLSNKNDTNGSSNGTHHDALYDAYATKRVFLECIGRLSAVTNKYSEIRNILRESSSVLAKILETNNGTHTLAGSVPILSKVYTNDKKLIGAETMKKEDLADKGKYYVGNSSLKEVLKALPKENVIFAFSQRHKTQIAKNLLHEIGLTHIDTGVHYVFDKKLLSLFFQKKSLDEQELYFAIKYYYHACSGHSTIDLNTHYDWKIYHALKEKSVKNAAKSAEILTHEQLYEKMRDQDIMPYTTVFFFDQDRWYDSHMKREQKPFDLYTLLQVTDSFIYRDKLLHPHKESPWQSLHTKLVIFIGVWQTEVAGVMKDVSNSMVEIDSIVDNTYFYKTNLLLPQIAEMMDSLEGKVEDDDFALIQEKRNRFLTIVGGSCAIMTKLQGEEVRFLVKMLHSFLDYSEFQQLFDMYQTIFLSHTKKDWPKLLPAAQGFTAPSIENWPGKEKISYDAQNIYIFSNNKQMSQDVLVWLHEHKPAKHKVHGENITGGKGKNIFAIKGSSHNIILGGYDFFLQCVSQKINIDKIYTLCINGPLQHIISADLVYYGNTSR